MLIDSIVTPAILGSLGRDIDTLARFLKGQSLGLEQKETASHLIKRIAAILHYVAEKRMRNDPEAIYMLQVIMDNMGTCRSYLTVSAHPHKLAVVAATRAIKKAIEMVKDLQDLSVHDDSDEISFAM